MLWNRDKFGNIQKWLENSKRNYPDYMKLTPHVSQIEPFRKAQDEVNVWLEQEELLWYQCSKALWLAKGDQNSK